MEDGRGTSQGRGYNSTFECDSELRLGFTCGSALAAASTPFYSWFCLELLFLGGSSVCLGGQRAGQGDEDDGDFHGTSHL